MASNDAVDVSTASGTRFTIDPVRVAITRMPGQTRFTPNEDFSVTARVTIPSFGSTVTLDLSLMNKDDSTTTDMALLLTGNDDNRADFGPLAAADYTLTASGVNIVTIRAIDFSVANVPATVTATVGDDLEVRVAVTGRNTLTTPITVTLALTGPTPGTKDVVLTAGIDPNATITFTGLMDGSYTLTATADPPVLNITGSPVNFMKIVVDSDGDGLIDINFLEDLDYIRHNPEGTSYKPGASASAVTAGAPTDTTGTACEDLFTPTNLCGYELMRDLDFDDAGSYRSGMVNSVWTNTPSLVCDSDNDPSTPPLTAPGSGWLPIGDDRTRFSTILEGNGHTISHLRVARDPAFIGLFGYIGRAGLVRNLTLSDVDLSFVGRESGNRDSEIGSLAGRSDGIIMAVNASGSVDAGNSTSEIGGLVGSTGGATSRIMASHASTTVHGCITNSRSIGGLVGVNDGGRIVASYASGAVDFNPGSSGQNFVGGLVGSNQSGTITASYASGAVDGGDGGGNVVGGLVGDNFISTITASYASGAVDGGDGDDDQVGGLVGNNFISTITASYASGAVDGGDGDDDHVGGLVGANEDGTITASYGFGTQMRGEISAGTIDRADDASPAMGVGAVTSATALTEANSSTATPDGTNDWLTSVWDFGTTSQRPILNWITNIDNLSDPANITYSCVQDQLPTGQTCGDPIPGQTR